MTEIERKLDAIMNAVEKKKAEKAISESDVYKVLLKAIDDSASSELTKSIQSLAEKLAEVEKKAPEYYRETLSVVSGLAKEIKDTELRLNNKASQIARNSSSAKQELEEKNQALEKLINSKTEAITKQLATLKLQHGKDGYTPVKGKDYFDGKPGTPGKDGNDGVGIENIDIKGVDLVITLTNGEELNLGRVVGRDGWSVNGKSAYQYAKEAGYSGTEQEFSQALISSGGGSWGSITGTLSDQTDLQEVLNTIPTDEEKTVWNGKQEALASGTNIKTINGASVLGSGDITVAASKTRKNFFIENDFMYNNTASLFPWYAISVNSGTMSSGTSNANHPGLLAFNSSSYANSGYYAFTGTAAILLAGSEYSEFIFKMPSSLNSATSIRLGFQNSTSSTAPTNGVWVDVYGSTVSGKTASNSSVSTTSTTGTLYAGTYYRVTVELNSDATLATFKLYADNSETAVWEDTLSTNIPTASSRETGHGVIATNSGTTSLTLVLMDYMNLNIERNLAR